MKGILPVTKPLGKTSFYVVACIRRLFSEKTVGHAGTLDPFATGVMIILIGKAFTRQSNQFLNQDKEYVTRLLLGKSTDTYDLDGQITATSDYVPTLSEIEAKLQLFQGTIEQTPPMFSAKKVNGKKLYELARQGKTIERKPCVINVQTELLSYAYPYLDLKVTCSKGTYIRSIAHDLGLLLSSYAHLTELKRTRSGQFSLDCCLDLEKLLSINFSESFFSVDEQGIIHTCDSLLCTY
ncbi:MAG: tRNA pseudouridine(55) synthase TruB [Chlamydiales bacterium]|nr:tRNA pseudouridine(55) synthase TruB [Chlamydiales bacterium]